MTSTDVVVRRDGMAAKVQYAKELANSGLLPKDYRKNPANVLYAVEYGEMLGLAPMAAITGIHVIDGKPTASASLISALVRRAGHRLRVTGNDTKAVAEIVRSDDPDFVFKSEWTLERAAGAGLVEVKNGKPWARDNQGRPKPWEKYPAAMLKARAITEVARDACEEALSGVHYTPEELGASVDEDGIPVQVQAERVQAPQDDTDWDAEIAAAGTDVEVLKGLYKKAAGIYGNSNPGLAERLVAAGKAAAAATEAASVAPDEVLDAELVEEAAEQPAKPFVAAVADAPTHEADTAGADQARSQIGNYIKATQIDPAAVAAHFKAMFGKETLNGTESELRKFLVALKAKGLPTEARAA